MSTNNELKTFDIPDEATVEHSNCETLSKVENP